MYTVQKPVIRADHLSAADVFTYLYFEEMNIDPKDPKNPDRDRFVLSKGHTAPGYYCAMAHRGYFPVEDLVTLRHVGCSSAGTSVHAASFRALICLPDPWDREFPQQSVWHLQENWTTKILSCIHTAG